MNFEKIKKSGPEASFLSFCVKNVSMFRELVQ